MMERPILFSAPMVRAILDGSKSQTRRAVKGNPADRCPYGQAGDLLWVRETWGHDAPNLDDCRRGIESDGVSYGPYYFADADWATNHTVKKIPSIHMPRWASRIRLTVSDVRVQRLQDISEEDAKAEGVKRLKSGRGYYSIKHGKAAVHFGVYHDYAKEAFAELWETINGAGSWDANPWVWAISFRVEGKS